MNYDVLVEDVWPYCFECQEDCKEFSFGGQIVHFGGKERSLPEADGFALLIRTVLEKSTSDAVGALVTVWRVM